VTASSNVSSQGTILGPFTLKDKVKAILRSLGSLSPYDKGLHPRSIESSGLLSLLLSPINMSCMTTL